MEQSTCQKEVPTLQLILMNDTYTAPPGDYYIGDPSYCFETKDGEKPIFGKIDGQFGTFFCGKTQYGDGIYEDNFGGNYLVDSGCIVLVPIDAVQTPIEVLKGVSRLRCQVFASEVEIKCSVKNGVIKFGPLKIDTNKHPMHEVMKHLGKLPKSK